MKRIIWNSPLGGWARLAAWTLATAAGATVTWMVIGLLQQDSWSPRSTQWLHTVMIQWLLAVVITSAVLGGVWFLARSLRSWRNFRRLLVGTGCAAGLIALAYAVEDIHGWLVWKQFKATWEAKGERFDFSAFVPPQVPEEKNFAMAPVVYTSYGGVLDKKGHHVQNTSVVNRLQMPIEANNDGPTNGSGNWQKGLRGNLEAWQAYYRGLSKPDKNQDRMEEAFARRYGLRHSRPPTVTFPVSPTQQTPAKDVLLALSIYDQTIEELRRAVELPETRFPLNYDAELPPVILLPHLASMKGCARVLRLRAAAELADGRGDAAVDDIVLALKLMEKIQGEPFLITHLVRIAMLSLTEQAIWEGMIDHRWNEAQLARLEEQLAKFDFVKDYRMAMRGENACCASTISYLMHHPSKLSDMESVGDGASHGLQEFTGLLIPSGWYRQNEVTCAKFMLEKYLPIADEERNVFYAALANKAGEEVTKIPQAPYTLLGKMLLPGLARSAGRFAQAQATVNLSLAACAAERYRLAHGKYPQNLADAVPDFIAKVPADPFAQVGAPPQPLHYQATTNDKFIAASAGWDVKDDAGKFAFNERTGFDTVTNQLVWAFPK